MAAIPRLDGSRDVDILSVRDSLQQRGGEPQLLLDTDGHLGGGEGREMGRHVTGESEKR